MADFLLLETGDYLLLETGDKILLEIQPAQIFKRIILTRSASDFTIKSKNSVRYILTSSERLTIRRTT